MNLNYEYERLVLNFKGLIPSLNTLNNFFLPVVSRGWACIRNSEKNVDVTLLLRIAPNSGTKPLHSSVFGVHHPGFDLQNNKGN